MPNFQTVVKTELLTATVENGTLVRVIVHSQTPGDKSFATLTEKEFRELANDIWKMSEALTAVQALGRAKVRAIGDDRCHCGGRGCNSCEPQGRG